MPFQEILKSVDAFLKDKYEHQTLEAISVGKPANVQLAGEWFAHFPEFAVLCNRLVESVVADGLSCFGGGVWKREKQRSNVLYFDSPEAKPTPRVIVKAWQSFPVERPTRFSESGGLFEEDNVSLINVGWALEHMIWGRIRILNVVDVSAKAMTEARNRHYYNPPVYVVCEEESERFSSTITDAKQTRGYKFIGGEEQLRQAAELAARLGLAKDNYCCGRSYQTKLYQLLGRFPYREDKDYAVIDLIEQQDVAGARKEALDTVLDGASVREFALLTGCADDELVCGKLKKLLEYDGREAQN
jgi:hypothetical protein